MPLFEYKAITAEGKKTKGVVDADTITFAKEKLHRDALTLLSLRERAEKKESLHLPSSLVLALRESSTSCWRPGFPSMRA